MNSFAIYGTVFKVFVLSDQTPKRETKLPNI